ncbi:MAG: VPDSG-CTERM sorting domain-containing protein [Verrucomicrobia bacterium]|nr:VPDSG-CTERM sorting domain-containing protein [Verrucomicrobiota bacterium]
MKRTLLITFALIGASVMTASAITTYTIEHSHSQGVGYANISFNSGSSMVNSYLGRFIMETQPLSGELPPQYPTYSISTVDGPETGFYSYCLEPLQPIGVGHGSATTYEYSIGSLAGTDGISTAEASLIRELFGLYSPLLQNDPSSGGFYTGGTFRTAAAALQLAIWKINLDASTETLGSWDFTSGLMRVGATAITAESGASQRANVVALAMLNSLTGTGPMASGLEGLRNGTPEAGGIQDVLIQRVPDGGTTFVLLGGALTGLGALRRKIRK